MNPDHPYPRLDAHGQATNSITLDLLEAYADQDFERVDALLESDRDWREIALWLVVSHAEHIKHAHVEHGFQCLHAHIDHDRARLDEEATLDELEADLKYQEGGRKGDRGMPKQPRFRQLYDIPDDCPICNGDQRPSNTQNLYAHCRAAHPRRDAMNELHRLNEAADRGEPVDYMELRGWVQ